MSTAKPRTAAEAVAGAVARALRANGLTQVEVAERTGIPRTTLIRKLRAQTPFNVADLDAISALVGRTPADLVAEAEARR